MSIQAGINIYSVHEQLAQDYYGTLRQLAEAGYTHLEMLGFNMVKMSRFSDEFPAKEVAAELAASGLKAIAAHEGPMPGEDLLAHRWDELMDYYEQLGCTSLVLPSVWMDDKGSTLRLAEQLDQLGSKLSQRGFQLYLHNHAHEFKSDGDTTLFDILAAHTDPKHLKFELDLVWVMRAGVDPIAVMERVGDRCDMIHQKDYSKQLSGPLNLFESIRANGDEGLGLMDVYRKYIVPSDFVDLGTGAFDFAHVYGKIKELGHVKYALVENEGKSADKLASVRNDLEYLRTFI
ncbi:Sugar phosphate isomerase/epimerase [Paenibacillus algorifonticola]|uniref:Sugar phosphate isomerase/epimerase n=1 Tax=Paenibacillus algorifonticola TaxID=684063 RepID=A0A1I2GM68_9BACL|nr:sugar phosphate isomerase/epimerase [Paenibacillus algorifonticola]SFF19034.1 Sugar phosphate isomerase/epimerase [Paenibacillus algorifonticola]